MLIRKLVDGGRKAETTDAGNDISEIVIRSDSKKMDGTSSQSIESCPLNGFSRNSNSGGNVIKPQSLNPKVTQLFAEDKSFLVPLIVFVLAIYQPLMRPFWIAFSF